MKNTVLFVHAIVDYVIGGLLLIGPWLFGFAGDPRATMITMVFGAAMIGYSLCTDYEPAVYRKIPLFAHLGLDMLCGGLLIGAPWMFGFATATWIPHLVIGTVAASRPALFLVGLRINNRVESLNADQRRSKAHRVVSK